MLATMRKALKKGLLQVIIWVTLVSMVIVYSGSDLVNLVQRILGLKTYALTVNGTKITPEEFKIREQEERKRIEMMQQQFGQYASLILAASGMPINPRDMAITSLIQDSLLDTMAHRFNIQLDSSFIRQSLIRQLPREVLDEEGNIDMDALRALFNYGSVTHFEQRFEGGLKRSIVLDFVESGLFIPSFVINTRYNELYAPKKFAILTFPLNKFITEAKKTPVDGQELKKFFDEENKKSSRYLMPEKRTATVWEFAQKDYNITVSKAEIENYYNKYKINEFVKQPAQMQIRRILLTVGEGQTLSEARKKGQQLRAELLKNPTLFVDYAKKYSGDKKTAEKGGLLDFVNKEQLEPAFADVVFGLEQDGQISELIQTEEGVELVQRVTRKAPIFKNLSDVEADIKKRLEAKKFQAVFPLEAKRVVRLLATKPESLHELAQQKQAHKKTVELSADDQSMLAKKLFGITKASDAAFFIESDKGYIVQLDALVKAHVPSLESVIGRVKDDFYRQRAELALKDTLARAKEAAKYKDFSKIADEFGALLMVTPFITSESKTELEKLQKDQLPLSVFRELYGVGSVSSSRGPHDGYLIKLEEVKPAPDDKEKKIEVIKNIFMERRNALEKGFIASLEKTATIKINVNELDKRVKR